jgi:hypothetical protein
MKKPRLFYFEEGVNHWCYINQKDVPALLEFENMEEGEEFSLRFMRKDMTDEEVDNLPDV